MRKTSIMIAAAIAALGSTVGMAHGTTNQFVRDGVTYEYTTETHGSRQVIEGHRVGTGEPFRLVVANGRVHGTSAGIPVSFDVSESRHTVQMAAR